MRVCSGGGCLRTVPDDVRYCAKCKPIAATPDGLREHSTAYDAELDAQRKSTRWQRTRLVALQRCPICARCGNAVSEICDHIVPAAIAVVQARESGAYTFDRWAGYYLQSNLQGLYRPCHGVKTLEDKTHVGPWDDVVEKERRTPKKRWTF